ncbi:MULTISPECIES: AcvB/VirJ family lysyl-phosphatidylglycerol hydrolase [unclassified Sphingomonas]|nr:MULTISPECIES: AcvB/VirJ family lysyl-phosphatidylglycerol hydrolase [unclassified Sphingomonas]
MAGHAFQRSLDPIWRLRATPKVVSGTKKADPAVASGGAKAHSRAMSRVSLLHHRSARVVAIVLLIGIGIAALWTAAGFFARDATRLYPADPVAAARHPAGGAAVLFSGDLGLRFGMGANTTEGLAADGIPVLGLNSPTLFRRQQTAAAAARIVADGVRAGLARTGATELVLIGQSFGADILQTGLVALPPALRRHVAGVVLVVPGDTVFFRADPSGIAYLFAPDSRAAATINRIDWTPLTCIYGVEERDSACPLVRVRGARVVGMPGGHFLHNDHAALVAHEIAAVRSALAARAGGEP